MSTFEEMMEHNNRRLLSVVPGIEQAARSAVEKTVIAHAMVAEKDFAELASELEKAKASLVRILHWGNEVGDQIKNKPWELTRDGLLLVVGLIRNEAERTISEGSTLDAEDIRADAADRANDYEKEDAL